MIDHGFRQLFVGVVLLLALGSPGLALERGTGSVSCRVVGMHHAAAYAASSPLATRQAVVLADSWGIVHFLSGGGRGRIVQVSVVAMSIALYIMMRKFNG
ncbi:MAG TPA: hypothetical protein VMF69_10795 [Gemmataceae bacterium]|nr:hypothetical protein [Gemmataceae bacterium]